MPTWAAIAHGGASSLTHDRDGPQAATDLALRVLAEGKSPLEAALEGCILLEDDPRFNAGTGSNLRLDGKTIEMDASCMASDGSYGAVACIRDVKNPVLVAAEALRRGLHFVAGEGAIRLAREMGLPAFDVRTMVAVRKFEAARELLRKVGAERLESGWSVSALRRNWNYEVALREAFGELEEETAAPSTPAPELPSVTDTVGIVVTDGVRAAGAASTGGTISTLLGRVGDVPMPGGGLFVSPAAQVAVTGDGDFLARKMLAREVHGDLVRGAKPHEAVARGISLFPDLVDVGIICIKGGETAAGSNRQMAWAATVWPEGRPPS